MAIFIFLTILFASLAIYAFITRKKVNTQIIQENKNLDIENTALKNFKNQLQSWIDELELTKEELTLENNKLTSDQQKLKKTNSELEYKAIALDSGIDAKQGELQRLRSTMEATAAAQKDLTNQAFEAYCETLNEAYAQADLQYDKKLATIQAGIEWNQKQLDEIAATRAAAQQALLKEQEVKENKDNYRLLPSAADLEDIQALERVRRTLHKPRILSMLIWQTFWQPLAKKLFPQILQDKTKCGIYKITNIQTNECYIGQSKDIYKRWSDHCKAGLGIDTPPGNKLYKAMQDYGLENFTFELLIECTQTELDSKEKYFIELYQAKEFGYNSNIGVNNGYSTIYKKL